MTLILNPNSDIGPIKYPDKADKTLITLPTSLSASHRLKTVLLIFYSVLSNVKISRNKTFPLSAEFNG